MRLAYRFMFGMLASLIATFLLLCGSLVASGKEVDYATAYNDAVNNGKPLVVLCSASWCGACQAARKSMNSQGRVFVYLDIENPKACGLDKDSMKAFYNGGSIPQCYRWEWTRTRER